MEKVRIINFKGSVVVLAILLLSGCAIYNSEITNANAPFYLAYDSDEVIRDQSKVATITSQMGLEINGVWANPQNMRSANASSGKKRVVVADVLPGEYRVRINPTEGRMNPITYHFEAGHIYNLEQITIVVRVKENTSPEVARKIAEKRNNAVFESK